MSADDPRVVQPQGMGAQHRYNPYTATLPHVAARSNTGRRPVQSFFMAEDLRQQFLLRSASVLARPEADGVLHLAPTARLSTSLLVLVIHVSQCSVAKLRVGLIVQIRGQRRYRLRCIATTRSIRWRTLFESKSLASSALA